MHQRCCRSLQRLAGGNVQPVPRRAHRTVVRATTEQVDVAIVGGGPGGLATAVALQRAAPDLSVRVFENARQLLPVGYIVMLTPNGLSCMQALGDDVIRHFEDAVFMPKSASTSYAYMKQPQADDPPGTEVPPPTAHKIDPVRQTSRGVRWSRLQEGLCSFLKPGTLELGRQLQAVNEELEASGRVLLTFQDRNSSQPDAVCSVSARLVVGADGNQSVVRQHLLKDGPPNFLNTVLWRGANPDEDAAGWPHKDEDRTSVYLFDAPSGVGILAGRAGDGKTVIYQVSAPWSESQLDLQGISRTYVQPADAPSFAAAAPIHASPQDKRDRCLSALRSGKAVWPAFVPKLVQTTPLDCLTEHGLFYREPSACRVWGHGPITLLGDAAHLGTPALGQGANMALEDAVTLGRAIAKHGPCEAALREYEGLRVDRVSRVQAGSVALAKKRWLEKGLVDEAGWHRENPWCLDFVMEPLLAPQEANA